MDYSNKGILVLLQDLQRIHFGKVSMYVDVTMSEENEPIVSCDVFDKGGEPHVFNFYTYESDDRRKGEYIKVMELVYETAAV